MPDNVIRVSSQPELLDALGSATQGTTILLEDGHYGDLRLSNQHFSDFVTIRSADGNGGATFNSVALNDVSRLRFDEVTVERPLANGESTSTKAFTVQNGSHHIEILNSDIYGSNDGNYDNDGFGLSVSKSSDIVVEGNTFHDLMKAGVFHTVDGLDVRGNDVRDIRSDGFDFAAVRNVSIENNSMTSFHPNLAQGDHADFIQFWTNGTSVASENVLIKGNVLLQDGSERIQGIFIRDELGTLAPRDFVIENNIVYNSSAHGISVYGGKGFTIQNNTVLTVPGNDYESKILINDGSTDIDVLNNAVAQISVQNGSKASDSGNLIAQWRDANGENYYGDLFVDAFSGDEASDFAPKPGGALDGAGIGAIVDGGSEDSETETVASQSEEDIQDTSSDSESAPSSDSESAPSSDSESAPDSGETATVLIGGDGKDFYFVDDPQIRIQEEPGGGWDSVESTVTYTLDPNVEKLTLAGSDPIDGFGNDSRNVLVGTGSDNILEGRGGNDSLYAGGGNDSLHGGAGDDLLMGGGGADKLAGGGGADVFQFIDPRDSASGDARDVIFGFKPSEGDVIDLKRIDANPDAAGNQDFVFIGTASFQGAAGELRYDGEILSGDVTGNGAADFEVRLVDEPTIGTNNLLGVADDFMGV